MNSKFNDFLKYTNSQKEVSLVVAKDEKELEEFGEILSLADYRQVVDTQELFKRITTPSKVYFIIRNTLHKDIYDFILQYPTGQVEIFNKERMASETVNPLYNGVSIVFLVTKETLAQIQQTGQQLLENTGLTYQN